MLNPRRLLVVALTATALLALPAPSMATPVPGKNGRIVLTSGRNLGDPLAQLFLLPVTTSAGGRVLSPPVTSANTVQHRHATWSPERDKIAYARGTGGDYDIYVQDLTNPGSLPQNITNSPNVTDDRPAWSPNGDEIAYESEVTDGSGQQDILVRPSGGGAARNLTGPSATIEGKPAWTPDSQTLIYSQGNVNNAPNGNTNDVKLMREPANNGGSPTLAVPSISGAHMWQPAVSPNGQSLCFNVSFAAGFSSTTEIFVAPLGGTPTPLTNNTAADYNCAWSPDSQLVAYVNGVLTTGKLVTERADNSSIFPTDLAQDPGADNFDGNPDWAPDGRPLCPDQAINATRNTTVTFTLECTDTGPAYEHSPVRETRQTLPARGTLDEGSVADPNDPFTYTPEPGFVGQVTFTYLSIDDFGFGDDTGTITINVNRPKTPGGGEVFDGTAGNDTINGTPGPDVINCGAGDDVVNGNGGDDVINCGDGNDRVNGNAGNDQVNGEGGDDELRGDEGNDQVTGGTGNDRANGDAGGDRVNGNSGNDRLGGDANRDRLNGDSGRDRVSGGSSNDRVSGGSSNDRVKGDSGNDRVKGDSGNDRVSGGRGNDRVSGGRGNDRVSGDSGRDRVSGDSGRDRLNGGRGRDRCSGGRGRDSARGCERRSRIP